MPDHAGRSCRSRGRAGSAYRCPPSRRSAGRQRQVVQPVEHRAAVRVDPRVVHGGAGASAASDGASDRSARRRGLRDHTRRGSATAEESFALPRTLPQAVCNRYTRIRVHHAVNRGGKMGISWEAAELSATWITRDGAATPGPRSHRDARPADAVRSGDRRDRDGRRPAAPLRGRAMSVRADDPDRYEQVERARARRSRSRGARGRQAARPHGRGEGAAAPRPARTRRGSCARR